MWAGTGIIGSSTLPRFIYVFSRSVSAIYKLGIVLLCLRVGSFFHLGGILWTGVFFPELIASEAATRSRRFTSLWSIPAFNKWVGAESSRVIGGVAYAAAGRGDNWDARVLRLDGVGAGGEEGSGPGPDVVVADDGAVRINVEHWCYGVAAKLGVEPGDF